MSAFRYLLAIFQQERTCITSLGIRPGRFRCILEGAVALVTLIESPTMTVDRYYIAPMSGPYRAVYKVHGSTQRF